MLQYVVFSLLVIVGMAATLWQVNIDPKVHPVGYQFLSQMSGTLLVGGVLSLLYKIFIDGAAEKRLRELLRIHDSIDMSGLKEVLLDQKNYNFTSFLGDPTDVQIVMNDGKRWIGNYSVELEQRFSRDAATTFFFADPNGKFIEPLAKKTELAPDAVKRKIADTEELLKATYAKSRKKGLLEIYYLKNYPTQSIFASKTRVIVTPYQTSSGRRAIPLFVYEDNKDERCYARDVMNDLNNVRNESQLFYSSNGKQ